MLHIFDKTKSYYNSLKDADIDILQDKDNGNGRFHFLITDLTYKGNKINLAIPIHANIGQQVQKQGLCIQTGLTNHTNINKVGGWNIAKALPYKREFFVEKKHYAIDKQLAEKKAQDYIGELKQKAQKMLDNYAKGVNPIHGLTNFDKALDICNGIVSKKMMTFGELKEKRAKGEIIKMEQVTKQNDNTLVRVYEKLDKPLNCIKFNNKEEKAHVYTNDKGQEFYGAKVWVGSKEKDSLPPSGKQLLEEQKPIWIPCGDAKVETNQHGYLQITEVCAKHLGKIEDRTKGIYEGWNKDFDVEKKQNTQSKGYALLGVDRNTGKATMIADVRNTSDKEDRER